MALFDHMAAQRGLDAENKYNELRKLLKEASKSSNTTLRHDFGIVEKIEPTQINVHDFVIAEEHMQYLEIEMSKLRKQIKSYRDVFTAFSDLLPNRNSEHVRLG